MDIHCSTSSHPTFLLRLAVGQRLRRLGTTESNSRLSSVTVVPHRRTELHGLCLWTCLHLIHLSIYIPSVHRQQIGALRRLRHLSGERLPSKNSQGCKTYINFARMVSNTHFNKWSHLPLSIGEATRSWHWGTGLDRRLMEERQDFCIVLNIVPNFTGKIKNSL